MPGPGHALLDQPAAGAETDLVAEAPREGAPAHPGVAGEFGQGERLLQALQSPGAGGRGARGTLFGNGLFDVLGLASVTERRDHAATGDGVGEAAAVVLADEVQADVHAGGGPGGREERVVVDEQHVRVEVDAREHAAEPVCDLPVRGRPAPVEEARGGEDEGAGADGDDPGAGADERERGQDLAGHLVGEVVGRDGRDHHGAGRGQDLGAVLHGDAEIGVGAHRTAADRAGQHLVPAVGRAEDPARDPQFEGVDAVQGQDHHSFTPHGTILSKVGNLAIGVRCANRHAGSP